MDIGNKKRVIIVEPLEEPVWELGTDSRNSIRENEGSEENSGFDTAHIWAVSKQDS